MKTNALPPLPVPPASAPLGTAATNGLRDIVGPVPIFNPVEAAIAAAITVLALGLAAYFLHRWWRRRQVRLSQGPPPPPPLPPHERARHRLDEALRLIPDPDRFCTEVSAIVRQYLEEAFGWNAPDRTTEEFLLEVRDENRLAAGHRELLQDFLTRCDFVKFARYDPTESELLALHGSAVRFVAETAESAPTPPPLPSATPPPPPPR